MPDLTTDSTRHPAAVSPQHNLTTTRGIQSSNTSVGDEVVDLDEDDVRRERDNNAAADNDSEPELAGTTRLPLTTTTALNCGYDCSHYIYSQPKTRLSYDSLTTEQREEMKTEYYHSYDFMIGVRTAASLGGTIALFSLFILYKTKCGSDSKRRRASYASSGGGSSWRRRRPRAAAGGADIGEPRPTPLPPGDIDIEKDTGGGASGGVPSFVATGFPALVGADERVFGRVGSTGGGRRDSRIFFPSTPHTPLSPAVPPTAGADIFQFTSGARFYDQKLSGAIAGSSGLSTYNDAPRMSCGNILPAAFHRAMPRLPPPSPSTLESSVMLHYGEISPRPYPTTRKGSSGGASSSSCGAAIPSSGPPIMPPAIRQQHQLHMPALVSRMKSKRKYADGERLGGLGSDPIDIQIIQPTPNVSPCGSTRRLSEDFVTVHAASFGGPRRTLSGGSRPRSRSDNAAGTAGPLIPLLAIPKVHRGSGHHHHAKSKSVKAKRFRDNSTQMSFENQDGGASGGHLVSDSGGNRDRSNSADQTVTPSRPFSYVPTTTIVTSCSATSPMGAPLSQPEVSTEDVCAAAAARPPTDNSGGMGGGIRFIDCSDSDGFSLSSDSGAFGCGSIDSDKPPGSPLNWAGLGRRSPGAHPRGGQHQRAPEAVVRQCADPAPVAPPADKGGAASTSCSVVVEIVPSCVTDTMSSGGSRRKVIGNEPDTAVSETQC